jgi:hypothetical protein
LARQNASSFASTEQAASQVGQIATTFLREQALKQAQTDAAGIVKYDEKGNLIVPTNFDAPIGGGLLYSQAYAEAARANYKHAAVSEFQNKAAELQSQFPTDPESFSIKLNEYRDAKVGALPPDLQPMMLGHFETIRAQGATAIAANRQKIVNETTMRNANDLFGTLVNDTVAFERSKASGNFAPQDYAAHEAKLADKWNDYAAMAKQAAMPQVWIDRQKSLAMTQAKARIFFENIGAQVGSAGESASVVFGANQEAIRKFENEHPGQEAQAILASEKQRAMSMAQAQATATTTAQNITYDNNQAAATQIRAEWSDRRREITSNPADYPDQQGELRRLDAEMNDRLAQVNRAAQTSNMRPMQKATVALATTNYRDEAMQRSMSMAVATQVNTLQDVSAPQWAKSSALLDLQTSLKSPEFVAYSLASPQGAALYRNVQQAVGAAHIQAAALDIGSYKEAWANGRVSPEREAEMLALGQRKGWIGNSVPGQIGNEELVQLTARNKTLFRKNSQLDSDAAIAINNIAQGGRPSKEEREKIAAVYPFKVQAYDYGKGQSVEVAPDFNNPGHVSSALAYINKTLTVPEGLRQWMETAPGVADPEKRKYMLSVGQSVQKVFDNHYMNGPKGPVSLDERKELVAADMLNQLGEGYGVMNAIANLGYDATPAAIYQYIAGETRKRENPAKPDETAKAVLDELQGVSNLASTNIFDDAYYGAASGIGNMLTNFVGMDQSTVKRWGMMSEAATHQLMQGIAAKSALSAGPLGSKPIEIHDDIKSHVIGHVGRYKDKYGKTDEENRLNPNRQGILDYFNRNGSDLALREVFDKDGVVSKYVLERKPFFLEANKAAGVNLNQKQWEEMMSLTARLKRPELFVDGGQGAVDPATVRVQSAERGDGSKIYGIYGYNWKANSTVYIGDVNPRDETVGFARARIYEAVATEMRDSDVAALLSNMPIFGALLDQKMKANFEDSIISQSGQRSTTSDFTASFFQTLRSAVSNNAPLAQFTGEKYDAAWKKVEVMAAKRDLNRYGGLGYLLGFSSPEYFIQPTNQVDGDVSPAWQDKASPQQQQGMQDAAKALEQSRARNRTHRKPE